MRASSTCLRVHACLLWADRNEKVATLLPCFQISERYGVGLGCSTGPVSAARFACLALCVDAVGATGQVPAPDLARVDDMLHALRTLAYLQPTVDQARPC